MINYKIAFNELTYTGFKVLMYCLLNKEWTAIGYGRWLGINYNTAQKSWKSGTQDLVMKGWMQIKDKEELSFTNKVREFIGKKE